MEKKEFKNYTPVRQLQPPYYTQEQLRQFQDEFNLLERELSVKKIQDAALIQNFSRGDKITKNFVESLKHKEKMTFEEYFEAMLTYFEGLDKHEAICEVLGQGSELQLSKQTVKQVLEEALGRRIGHSEMIALMDTLKREGGGGFDFKPDEHTGI